MLRDENTLYRQQLQLLESNHPNQQVVDALK
jgi:hypothetical protein